MEIGVASTPPHFPFQIVTVTGMEIGVATIPPHFPFLLVTGMEKQISFALFQHSYFDQIFLKLARRVFWSWSFQLGYLSGFIRLAQSGTHRLPLHHLPLQLHCVQLAHQHLVCLQYQPRFKRPTRAHPSHVAAYLSQREYQGQVLLPPPLPLLRYGVIWVRWGWCLRFGLRCGQECPSASLSSAEARRVALTWLALNSVRC